jgi:hypothetical protein
MNPNVQANPSMMLPPNLLRGGQNTPGQIFQQDPLSQNMSPSAMGADPSTMQQPPAGSAANNPTMPGGTPPPMAGMQQANGQPGAGDPQLSEAQYILNVLADRLKHHSKITEKTVGTLSDMIAAGMPMPDQSQQPAPTA